MSRWRRIRSTNTTAITTGSPNTNAKARATAKAGFALAQACSRRGVGQWFPDQTKTPLISRARLQAGSKSRRGINDKGGDAASVRMADWRQLGNTEPSTPWQTTYDRPDAMSSNLSTSLSQLDGINPSLTRYGRSEPAPVLPLREEPDLLSWLETSGRLVVDEETAATDVSTVEEEELSALMGEKEDYKADDEQTEEDWED